MLLFVNWFVVGKDSIDGRTADKLADTLTSEGIECFRVRFPLKMDANAYACIADDPEEKLGVLIHAAAWMGKDREPKKRTRRSNPPSVISVMPISFISHK